MQRRGFCAIYFGKGATSVELGFYWFLLSLSVPRRVLLSVNRVPGYRGVQPQRGVLHSHSHTQVQSFSHPRFTFHGRNTSPPNSRAPSDATCLGLALSGWG